MPGLIFASKAMSLPRGKQQMGAIFGKTLPLLENIRLWWKCFQGTNTLAYFASLSVTKKKKFYTLT
jgi:hypothetical protein